MPKQEPLTAKDIPLSGKLIESKDPSVIGENFQTLDNLRYTDTNIKGVGGMTKVNTTALTTELKVRSAHHFKKQQPVESHILTQAFNTGLTASKIKQNTTTPPTAGNFSTAALHTEAANSDTGVFSDAPDGNVAYCNGDEAMIWGGDEHRVARFINYDPNGTFSYDFTEQVTNTLTDAGNLATMSVTPIGADSNSVLLLHMDGADGSTTFTDSLETPHTVTPVGNAQIDTARSKFGGAGGLFDGTGDYLTIPDHADFDFSGGEWTIDFWMYSASSSLLQTIYYQETDSNNYFTIVYEAPPSGASRIVLQIKSGGVTSVLLSSGGLSVPLNTWTHIEISESGDTYSVFVNGILINSIGDTDRPANYTGLVQIGSDGGNFFSGTIDELMVSTIQRHSADFEPQSTAYVANTGFYAYLGSTRPLKGFKASIGTANTTPGAMHVDYWDGTAWAATTNLSDWTASGGAPLAQTGSVTFDSTEAIAKVKVIDGIVIYWYRVVVPEGVDTTTTIPYLTVNAPLQTVKDIWDGTFRNTNSFQKFVAGSFQDNTVNVEQDKFDSTNTATFAQLGSLTTATEYLVKGFTEQMMGVNLFFIGGSVNATVSTVITVSYWNGTAWVPLSASDGTSEASVSFSQSGVVSWHPPSRVVEFKQSINGSVPLYYYKFQFSQTLSADVKLFFIGGITAQKDIKGFKFPLMADNRLFLASEKSDEKNAVIVSAQSAPDVWNGKDTERFKFGNETTLTAGAWLYQQIGADIRSLKIFTKSNETWVLEGLGPSTWVKYQISDKIGCIAPLTMATAEIGAEQQQIAIWQGARGIYICDGRSIFPIHADIGNVFDDAESVSINVSKSKDSVAWIDTQRMEYHWLYADGTSTTLNREAVYDIIRKRWFRINRGNGNELQFGFEVQDSDGTTYTYGMIDTGFMMRLENGQLFDQGVNQHTFRTGDININGLMNETEIRKIKLMSVANTSGSGAATISHYGDSKAAATQVGSIVQSSTDRRVVSEVRSHRLGAHTLHSFKVDMFTSPTALKFEPLALGIFYKNVRKDVV